MRIHHLFVFAAAVAGALGVASACARTEAEPGALMLSVQTDMRAPDAIDKIGIYITVNREVVFAVAAEVSPVGLVTLPSTLAVVGKNHPGAEAKIRVAGFKGNHARIVRDAVVSIPLNRTALMRLPLRWVNDGQATGDIPVSADDAQTFDPFVAIHSNCKVDETPINGECASAHIETTTLPDYIESDVFGGGRSSGGGTCFDAVTCFAKVTDVTATVDPVTCTFTAPPGTAFTVGIKVAPDSGGTCGVSGCFVPLDANEDDGWKRAGTSITLPVGVCKQLGPNGRALGIVVSPCAAKAVTQPLCGPASAVGDGAPVVQ